LSKRDDIPKNIEYLQGTCHLADGTQFGDILHLFENVKEGLKVYTKVGIVKAADDELLSGH
jgi:hypothetical protein